MSDAPASRATTAAFRTPVDDPPSTPGDPRAVPSSAPSDHLRNFKPLEAGPRRDVVFASERRNEASSWLPSMLECTTAFEALGVSFLYARLDQRTPACEREPEELAELLASISTLSPSLAEWMGPSAPPRPFVPGSFTLNKQLSITARLPNSPFD